MAFLNMRKLNNLTQEQVAEKLNIDRSAISRWETGVCLPDTKNLINLAKLYDCTVDDLLQDNPVPELDTA